MSTLTAEALHCSNPLLLQRSPSLKLDNQLQHLLFPAQHCPLNASKTVRWTYQNCEGHRAPLDIGGAVDIEERDRRRKVWQQGGCRRSTEESPLDIVFYTATAAAPCKSSKALVHFDKVTVRVNSSRNCINRTCLPGVMDGVISAPDSAVHVEVAFRALRSGTAPVAKVITSSVVWSADGGLRSSEHS